MRKLRAGEVVLLADLQLGKWPSGSQSPTYRIQVCAFSTHRVVAACAVVFRTVRSHVVRAGPSLLHSSWLMAQRMSSEMVKRGWARHIHSRIDLELDCFLWEPKDRGSIWKCALSKDQNDENHKMLVKEIRVKYLVHGSDDAMCKDVNSS